MSFSSKVHTDVHTLGRVLCLDH